MLSDILWILRIGTSWSEMPKRYPPYQTCRRRWTRNGVMDAILRALAKDLKELGDLDLKECFIDGTFVIPKRGRWGGKDQAGES